MIFLVTRFLGDGVRVFAGSVPLALLTGWSIPTAIIVMGLATLVYTWFGGLKAVVWADVLQLMVYVTGGIAALWVASGLGGGLDAILARAAGAGKLTIINPELSLTIPYTLLGGIVGGAMLSAASHGTDQLIVQRLLATRSLRDARIALVGSGVVVMLQFALFLLVGIAIWAIGQAPETTPGDQVFPGFIIHSLPAGIAGLVIAGILAAAMSSHSSAITALASAVTYDLYASITGRRDPMHLLRVGRFVSLVWGLGLIVAALGFAVAATHADTPAVVLALSIASITYGALLGTYILAGRWPRATGRDVLLAVAITVLLMLVVVFANRLPGPDAVRWLGRLAWPWYVPLGTLVCVVAGILSSLMAPRTAQVDASR